MGWVMMSERELNRIEVLTQVDDGRLSVQNGAHMLDITKRQMFRLLKTYRTDGAAAHRMQADRRARDRKMIKYPEQCKRVIERIKDGWTPEQSVIG
jgi:hypothetical protein